MKNIILILMLIFPCMNSFSQTVQTNATYFEGGINSPWSIGLDYDIGFAGLISFNTQLIGGINSQVNKNSTFGDVFFGEFQLGPRLYMNKLDKWDGLFLATVFRIGIYNIPFRSGTELILSRNNMAMYGMGVYLGYRWKRNLVNDMKDFPFILVIEPYLGWSLDSFIYNSNSQNTKNINRFTLGFIFKLGFYTHKKSAKTLAAELSELEEKEAEKNKTELPNKESQEESLSNNIDK